MDNMKDKSKLERDMEESFNSKINIEAIRSAALNSKELKQIAFEVKTIDPLKLKMEDTIYSFVLKSINDSADKNETSTAQCIAIRKTVVDTLSNRVKPEHITVNGDIDIPKRTVRLTTLENVYMSNQDDARAIAEVVTKVELDRIGDLIKVKEKEQAFLKKQIEDNRY